MNVEEILGFCEIVFELADGTSDRHYLICRAGVPAVGSGLDTADMSLPREGDWYVDRVVWVGDKRVSDHVYAHPVAYLRPLAFRPSAAPPPSDSRTPDRSFPSNHSGTRAVLPLRLPNGSPSDIGAWIFPAPLVANLVAVGYRIQATDFQTDRRLAAERIRSPRGYGYATDLPDVLHALSREAKHCGIALADFFAGVAPGTTKGEETADAGNEPPTMGKLLELRPTAGQTWKVRVR